MNGSQVLQSEDVRLLTQLGMVGAGAGIKDATEALFRGLMTLRPQRDFAYIGLASLHLNQRRPEEAVRVLEQGLRVMVSGQADDSDLAMVQAFLGLTLIMSKRTAEAMALLKTLLANSQHEPALRMARGLMGLPVAPQQQHSTQEIA